MAAFLRYLNEKRRNAVWGDDPEVQALCEIYDRPAEIWAYDQQVTVEVCVDPRRRVRGGPYLAGFGPEPLIFIPCCLCRRYDGVCMHTSGGNGGEVPPVSGLGEGL